MSDVLNQYDDESMEMVSEFHRTFHCYEAATPTERRAEDNGAAELRSYANQIRELGSQLKDRAASYAHRGRDVTSLLLIRLQLMVEELGEVAQAMSEGNLPQILHELGDLSYVVDGTYLTYGLGDYKLPAIREIHRANMSKLDKDGKPIIHESGRVMKGPNFLPADMTAVMEDVRATLEPTSRTTPPNG